MKIFYKFTVIFFLFIFMASCNEEITLNTNFEPQIFIFGNLTNEANKLTITIQESVPVESTSKEPKPVHNAKITLLTENSNGEVMVVTNDFIENNGAYNSTSLISPVIGNLYWIEIELEDGTLFKSEREKLNPVVSIDEVVIVNDDYIKTAFKDPADVRNFYRLEIKSLDTDDEWSYNLDNDIFYDGSKDAFIPTEIFKSKNVRATLLNINYSTYQFYLNVSTQEESQGNDDDDDDESGEGPFQLFAPPPVHLTGNIINTKTNRKALGNFGIISMSILDADL